MRLRNMVGHDVAQALAGLQDGTLQESGGGQPLAASTLPGGDASAASRSASAAQTLRLSLPWWVRAPGNGSKARTRRASTSAGKVQSIKASCFSILWA